MLTNFFIKENLSRSTLARLKWCNILAYLLLLAISSRALLVHPHNFRDRDDSETSLQNLDRSGHLYGICDYCECTLVRTAISVDCHNKNLTALPNIVPMNTKILNLTSNRIDSLAEPMNSKNWENVTYVDLTDNLISSFQPLEINSKFMRNLASLDIRKNKFQQFPIRIFEQLVNLDKVYLSDNPWICDCESTFAFQGWIQRQFHKVYDKEEIRCGIAGSQENGVASYSKHQRLSNLTIYRLSKSELCPEEGLEEPYDWLDFLNLFLGLSIVLVLTKLVLDYVYQYRTKRFPHFFRLNY